MAHRLAVSLTGDHLILELTGADAHGSGSVLRRLFGRPALARARKPPLARVVLQGSMTGGELDGSLIRAVSDLQRLHGTALHGMALDVQLGLDHSRIGLVDLSGVSPASLSAGNCDAYARAWAAQMLHLNPLTSVIRWELLERSRKLLISCVSRTTVAILDAFCARSGLDFSGCRPAVLGAVDRARLGRRPEADAAAGRTVAWTEENADGSRSCTVQLLRFQGLELAALWRGWVPATAAAGGHDRALEDAIARFDRINPAASGAAVDRLVWPAPAPVGTPA